MSLDQVQGAAHRHPTLLTSHGHFSTNTSPHRANPALRKARSELRLWISTSADISERPSRARAARPRSGTRAEDPGRETRDR